MKKTKSALKSAMWSSIKEEILKVLSEERDPQQILLINGALNQIKEAGESAKKNMVNNLTYEEALTFNKLVQQGLGKEFPSIPTDSPAADPRLTPGTTD